MNEQTQTFLNKLNNLSRLHRGSDDPYHMASCPAHDDTKPSMAVYIRDDGSFHPHCFAGCSHDDIMTAVNGVSIVRDFRHRQKVSKPKSPSIWRDSRFINATYDYTDAAGRLLFQKVRFSVYDEKRPKYMARHKVGERWHYGKGQCVPELFNLPDVLKAERVLICEGEKDANRVNAELSSIGLYGQVVATTTHDGAGGKWQRRYTDALRGKDVVILPDNDEIGRKHADKIKQRVTQSAMSVKVVKLPELAQIETSKGIGTENGADVSDWLDNGHDIHDLVERIDRTRATWGKSRKAKAEHKARRQRWQRPDVKQMGTVATFTAAGARFAPKYADYDVIKRHNLVKRLHNQTSQYQTIYVTIFETQAEFVQWRDRTSQRAKRCTAAHVNYVRIPQQNGIVIALHTVDGESLTTMPRDWCQRWDMIMLIVDRLPNTQLSKRLSTSDGFGRNYAGMRGDGARKQREKRTGQREWMVQYHTSMDVTVRDCAGILGIGVKKAGTAHWTGDPADAYDKLKAAGVDLFKSTKQQTDINDWKYAREYLESMPDSAETIPETVLNGDLSDIRHKENNNFLDHDPLCVMWDKQPKQAQIWQEIAPDDPPEPAPIHLVSWF
ncbi:MAG: hypothetical protein M9918_21400 [Anaerolineae bacterium]|nr:hypothetical protein [Anaerolineae bacterium]MCO5195556.1 hypothetical protein [Anaerolineae bacterium]